MALTKCKECGGLLSTLAEKCPHCGAPVDKEPLRPVEAPHVAAFDKPQPVPEPVHDVPQSVPEPVKDESQPVPEPVVDDAPEYDEEESHTARNVTLIVLFLLLAAAGGYYYYQHSRHQQSESLESWEEDTDFTDADPATEDNTTDEDTCTAESVAYPPETESNDNSSVSSPDAADVAIGFSMSDRNGNIWKIILFNDMRCSIGHWGKNDATYGTYTVKQGTPILTFDNPPYIAFPCGEKRIYEAYIDDDSYFYFGGAEYGDPEMRLTLTEVQ